MTEDHASKTSSHTKAGKASQQRKKPPAKETHETKHTKTDDEDHKVGHDLQLLERRLFRSRSTKRLDLSAPATTTASQLKPNVIIHFQVLPKQIFTHGQTGHHLQELWLTNHRLSILPPEIGELVQLRVLGLDGNALSTLPSEISQLESLESLYLERNQLGSIPSTVQLPRRLRDLRLDHNTLVLFPLQITQLRLLNRLGLSHNHLTEVPPQIRRLTNLVELDLDHNHIGPTLPDVEFVTLRYLERLGLEGNCLNGPPLCLGRMPTLKYVRLSGNLAADGVSNGGGVSRRQDGYYQLVEGYQPHRQAGLDGRRRSQTPLFPLSLAISRPLLAGIVPCSEQNVLNAESYQHLRHSSTH